MKIDEDLEKEINMGAVVSALLLYMNVDILVNGAPLYYRLLAMILNIPGIIYERKLIKKLEEKMK